jgi:hypothetical protein
MHHKSVIIAKRDNWPYMDAATVIERGQEYMAHSDAWNLDTYLAHVIVRGINLLEAGPAEQSKDLKKIRKFFQEYIDHNGKTLSGDDHEKFLKKKKKAFKLLEKNFEGLWD